MAVTIDENSGSTRASYDNVKETFPVSVATTGEGADEVDVENRDVFGDGTAFTTDFKVGDFIWLTTNDEIRRIENIVDDEKMTLELPATNVTGETVKVVPLKGFSIVSYLIDENNSAEINGINMPSGSSDSWKSDWRFIPILIDSSVNGNVVYVSANNG